jgi:uncharacterized protein (DUF1800 family)
MGDLSEEEAHRKFFAKNTILLKLADKISILLEANFQANSREAMKRRESIAQLAGALSAPADLSEMFPDEPVQEKVSPFANKVLPKRAETLTGLEAYAGPWTIDQAQHLLRRTTFGPSRTHVEAIRPLTMDGAVNTILALQPEEPTAPLVYYAPSSSNGEVALQGTTWVDSVYRDTNPATNPNGSAPTGLRSNSLKAWWMGLLVNQSLSIREKMVLFWHNHFVTEIVNVGEPRYSYRYAALLRRYALGNFKDLVREVTKDGAMLVYLNGTNNQKSGPDENYGRELQELFTIGKGPLAGPNDYTNYTEADVKAAARLLTGWRKYQNADGTIGLQTGYFDASRHDTTNKTFSARYNNTVITGGTDGALELANMLEMIFAQPETARFICRKLYRWFVYYAIDANAEANVILPMANLLRQNNYDVLPVLQVLFRSAHFYDPINRACVIKSPIDFVAGVCRQFGVVMPADVAKQYTAWYNLMAQAGVMQQDLGEPPNVAGWPAYYQTPEFYELWINSDTLPKRKRLTDLMTGNGYTSGGVTLVIDMIAFTQGLPDPANVNTLIADVAKFFLAAPLLPSLQTTLKDQLMQGYASSEDYEWTNEWVAFMIDQSNVAKRTSIKSKLQRLYSLLLSLPEYQLS